MTTFGERLRTLLEREKIEGKDFAIKLNVSQPTVSNWVNDNRFPSQETLIGIANYFNVSVDYLLGRTDSVFLKEYEQYKNEYNVQDEIVTIAAHALEDLNDEDRQELLEYAKILKKKRAAANDK